VLDANVVHGLDEKKPLRRLDVTKEPSGGVPARVLCGHKAKDPQQDRSDDEQDADAKRPGGHETDGIVLQARPVGKQRFVVGKRQALSVVASPGEVFYPLLARVVGAVDVLVLDPPAGAVAAPGPVHGLQELDRNEDGGKPPDVAQDADDAPGVVESDKVLDAENHAEDGIEAQQAKDSWVGPVRVLVDPNRPGLEFLLQELFLLARKGQQHEPLGHAHAFEDKGQVDGAEARRLALLVVALDVGQELVVLDVLEHLADAFDNVVVDQTDVGHLDAQRNDNEEVGPALHRLVHVRMAVFVAFCVAPRGMGVGVVAVGTRFGARDKVLSVAACLFVGRLQQTFPHGKHRKGRKVQNPTHKGHKHVTTKKQGRRRKPPKHF